MPSYNFPSVLVGAAYAGLSAKVYPAANVLFDAPALTTTLDGSGNVPAFTLTLDDPEVVLRTPTPDGAHARMVGQLADRVDESEIDAQVTALAENTGTALGASLAATFAPAYQIPAGSLASGADNRDAIDAHLVAAAAAGRYRVVFPPGDVSLGSRVTIPADNMLLEANPAGTTIVQVAGSVNMALIYAAGTEGSKVALTGDLAAGATSLTIPTEVASTLSRGDLLGLEAATTIHSAFYASEIRKVTSVSGTAVTVDGPLLWAYATADSAVAWKITPRVGVKIKGFTFTSSDSSAYMARSIYFLSCQDVAVEGVTLRDAGGGIFFHDCIDFTARDVLCDTLVNQSSFYGYGVVAGGRSAHGRIEGLSGRNVRHLFTTLSDERTGSVMWGAPRHVKVTGGTGEAAKTGVTYAPWDTHPYSYDITFDGCMAYGGSGSSGDGFQLRGVRQRLVGCSAFRSGDAAVKAGSADGVQIVGGEFANSTSMGIKTGKNTQVLNAWVHDNGGAGITFSNASTGARVIGSLVKDNGTYGLHDQSTAGTNNGVVVQGCTVPKGSGVQSIGCLSPKGDLHWVNNVVPGYGSGNDGVGGSPDGTVTRSGNYTD